MGSKCDLRCVDGRNVEETKMNTWCGWCRRKLRDDWTQCEGCGAPQTEEGSNGPKFDLGYALGCMPSTHYEPFGNHFEVAQMPDDVLRVRRRRV